MALIDLHLSLMTFPQQWTGTTLTFNLLVLPNGDPLQPLGAGAPTFAGTELKLRARIIPSLDDLPKPASPSLPFALSTPPPPGAKGLFEKMPNDGSVKIVTRTAKLLNNNLHIWKRLPATYLSVRPSGDVPDFAVLDDRYGCALLGKKTPLAPPPPPAKNITWGEILSYALRQPALAQALGLSYSLHITPEPPDLLSQGGWLWVELDDTNPGNPYVAQAKATADWARSYAARLPALQAPRRLFAAVLFPVVPGVTNAPYYDDVSIEASAYDDGFAKIVHTYQPVSADAAAGTLTDLPPATDAGIQIGWDDEQVLAWHNRQLDVARDKQAGTFTAPETPLGVMGYRVDARDVRVPGGGWQSLCRARAHLDLAPLPTVVEGDLNIEPVPMRSADPADLEAWLPQYFAMWRGKSLVAQDLEAFLLTGGTVKVPSSNLVPVLPANLPLLYGRQYDFRVRLADLSGGGPTEQDQPLNPAEHGIAPIRFLRHLPPKSVRIETDPPPPASPPPIRTIATLRVWRPLISYPEFKFAGVTDPTVVETLIGNMKAIQAAKGIAGVNDPDVASVEVVVEVRAPLHDTGDKMDGFFREVYRTTLAFPPLSADPLDPGAPLDVSLDYQAVPHIEKLKAPSGATLPIPANRDVRIRLTPVCEAKPDYYASDAVRWGITSDIATRSAAEEGSLYLTLDPTVATRAFLLAPSAGMAQLLAQHADLDVSADGLTFSGKAGRRTVLGASNKLRHTLAGDRSSLTFAANSELLHHWIVALRMDLDRDWTWDGLADAGVEFKRGTDAIGTLPVPLVASDAAQADDPVHEPDKRSVTHLVFFDAIDPNPPAGAFPEVLTPAWTAEPSLRPGVSIPDPMRSFNIKLPIAANPRQTPEIASAGIALSPFQAAEDYSSTSPRKRMLWIEFKSEIDDPHDQYFARVLSYGPDPLLMPELPPATATDLQDPPLAIDPELIRVITPGMSDDDSGKDAMTPLLPSASSSRHYLLPLPPGVTEDALELFGFWTYEFRVGHSAAWSTAQARFGRPLRATGIQHPAPALTCMVNRTKSKVVAAAPYATPVVNGRRCFAPSQGGSASGFLGVRSRMWVMLYAQVTRADAAATRNVLLLHKEAPPVYSGKELTEGHPQRDIFGVAEFGQAAEIDSALKQLSLPLNSPLSVLAVELLPGGTDEPRDPVGSNLGDQRILRTSPLTKVAAIC